MIKADFHLHTEYSPDSIAKLEDLYQKAQKIGLGKLIITDHNTIAGAVKIQRKYPDFVVIGEEILTTSGEILAYFVQEEIPEGLEPIEALKRLKDQGAFISLAHPYAFKRNGWQPEEMIALFPWIDAIETRNGRNPKHLNLPAIQFAAEHGLPGTAGSDSHSLREFGKIGLKLPDFSDAESLRKAIRDAVPFGEEAPAYVHLYSRYAVLNKKLRKKATPKNA